jgi:hypothetical protein
MHVITRQDRSSESLVLPPPSTSLGPSSAQSPSSSYTRRALLSRSTHHTTPPSPLNPVNGIFCNRTETNYHSTPRERAEHNKAQGRDGSAEAAVPPAAALTLSSCLRWQPTGTGCHRSNTYVRDDVNIIQKTPHGVPASQVEAIRTYANVRYFALLMYSESMILTRRSSERRHGLTHTRRLLAATSLQTSSLPAVRQSRPPSPTTATTANAMAGTSTPSGPGEVHGSGIKSRPAETPFLPRSHERRSTSMRLKRGENAGNWLPRTWTRRGRLLPRK